MREYIPIPGSVHEHAVCGLGLGNITLIIIHGSNLQKAYSSIMKISIFIVLIKVVNNMFIDCTDKAPWDMHLITRMCV